MGGPQRIWVRGGDSGSRGYSPRSTRGVACPARTLAMLDLRQLHYFVVVVEEGQMTRAAARLHIAQPALSQAVAKLETDPGGGLFERPPPGVTPTGAGSGFFGRASRALIAVEEAQEAVEPWLRAGPRVVIGFHEAAGDLARALIRRFMLAHPGVDVETR